MISDMNLIHENTKKMYRYFLIILSANVIFELFMATQAVFTFDLSRVKHLLYFSSYLFLFVTSAEVFFALIIWKKHEKESKLLAFHTYFYTASLFIWSAFVSAIDYVSRGDSGIMVFVMISMALAVLTRIKPIWFMIMMGISTFGMLFAIWCQIGFSFSSGFFFNLVVFILLAWFICMQSYRLAISELKISRQLTLFSITDQLTGIYNRRKLDSYIKERTEKDDGFIFILLDIDDFKIINDTNGHTVGDDCLVLVANKLSEYFGANVFRFGGDEFAVIADMDCENADIMMKKIDGELCDALPNINLHISAGILPVNEKTLPRDIFVYADRALYEAKKSGKACNVIYKK